MNTIEERNLLSEEIDENVIESHDEQAPKGCHLIEPIAFLLHLAFTLFGAVLPNTIEVQYCRSVLNIDRVQCLNISDADANEIQKFTSTFFMFRSCAELLLPSVLSFFLGPWSDTFGRKPLLLTASVGYCITFSLWTWGTSVKSLNPLYFISFSIPIALSGGRVVQNIATYCYICDISSTENRGARLGSLLGCQFSGTLIGTLIAPHLIVQNYTTAFAVAAVITYVAVIFLCFLSESVTASQVRRSAVSKNPFKLDQLRSIYQSCYMNQSRQSFLTLSLVIILVSLSLFQIFGESTVFYLFLQHTFGWTLADYTPLGCFSVIVGVIGVTAGSWLFSKYLKVHDLLILVVAVFCREISALIMVFSSKVWHVYLSKAVTTGLTGSAIRTFVSKNIAPEDIGKVFSLFGALESLMPMIGSVAYGNVYEATMLSHPRAVFLLSGTICAATTIITAIIVKIHIRPSTDHLRVLQTPAITN